MSSVKHLPGEHDQLDHGRRGGGGATDLYAGHAGTPDDPVPCGGDIERAAEIIANGGHVQLDQPDEVATLLDKLRDIVKDAKAKGEKAPIYDLCNVTVPGTNLFCQDSLTRSDGSKIDRVEMPQLSTKDPIPGSYADSQPRNEKGEVDISRQFGEFLESSGRKVTNTTIDASHLRASQDDLEGGKVAGIAGAMAAGIIDVNDPDNAIFVTRDNYVIDGHHRWAAAVAEQYTTGKKIEMPVKVVDIDIGTALTVANFWTDEMGIPPADIAKKNLDLYRAAINTPELLDVVRKMSEPAKHLPGQHDQDTHGRGGGNPLPPAADPPRTGPTGEIQASDAGDAWSQLDADRFDRDQQEKAHPENYEPNRGFGVHLKLGATEWRRDVSPEGVPTVYQVLGTDPRTLPIEDRAAAGLPNSAPDGTPIVALRVEGSEQPDPFVYRIMSVTEFNQAQERGYFESNQSMNLADEGTVTSRGSTGTFYAPPNGEDMRVVQLDMDPDDGWKVDRDGYVKTHQQVPFARARAFSTPLANPRAMEGAKHLPGQHDQLTHGRGGGGWTSVGEALASAGVLESGQYLRWDPNEYAPGEKLPASRRWDDGESTDDVLDGTSVIDPHEPLSPGSLSAAYEGRVYVVEGERVGVGEDPGEVIVRDPVVVRVLDGDGEPPPTITADDPAELLANLDNAYETPEEIAAALQQLGAVEVKFDAPGVESVYLYQPEDGSEPTVITWDKKTDYSETHNAYDWVGEQDPEDYYPEHEQQFNDQFWRNPDVLYHGTDPDRIDSILADGLEMRSETRGLSNRYEGAAVYTSTDPGDAEEYYGQVLVIDTAAMAADGLKPFVNQEPDVVRADLEGALASHLGLYDYEPEYGSDTVPTTVVVNADIPAQYITVMSLAKACAVYAAKQARARKAATKQQVVVCGPPCSGKTTYVRAHVGPDETVLDFDDIRESLGGDRYEATPEIDTKAQRLWVEQLKARPDWVIWAGPTRQQRARMRREYKSRIVVMDTPKEVCLERAAAERPDSWGPAIDRWFETWEPSRTEPEEVLAGAKHLPGQHDQLDHGRRGGADVPTTPESYRATWRPTMTPEEGHAWARAAGTKYPKTVVHMTGKSAVDGIKGSGFDMSVQAVHEAGRYFALDPESAEFYSYKGNQAVSAVVVAQNPVVLDWRDSGDITEAAQAGSFRLAAIEAAGYDLDDPTELVRAIEGPDSTLIADIDRRVASGEIGEDDRLFELRQVSEAVAGNSEQTTMALKAKGYDSVVIYPYSSAEEGPVTGGQQIVVFDREQAVVIGNEDLGDRFVPVPGVGAPQAAGYTARIERAFAKHLPGQHDQLDHGVRGPDIEGSRIREGFNPDSRTFSGLRALATHYETFEEFQHAYSIEGLHGRYWHLTADPDFELNPHQQPEDVPAMVSGRIDETQPGHLMVTDDPKQWPVDTLGQRPYAVQVDLDDAVPYVDYWPSGRGYNEVWIQNLDPVTVGAVITRDSATSAATAYFRAIPQSEEELRLVWDAAHDRKKHLPGQHDQLTHGRGGGGIPDTDDLPRINSAAAMQEAAAARGLYPGGEVHYVGRYDGRFYRGTITKIDELGVHVNLPADSEYMAAYRDPESIVKQVGNPDSVKQPEEISPVGEMPVIPEGAPVYELSNGRTIVGPWDPQYPDRADFATLIRPDGFATVLTAREARSAIREDVAVMRPVEVGDLVVATTGDVGTLLRIGGPPAPLEGTASIRLQDGRILADTSEGLQHAGTWDTPEGWTAAGVTRNREVAREVYAADDGSGRIYEITYPSAWKDNINTIAGMREALVMMIDDNHAIEEDTGHKSAWRGTLNFEEHQREHVAGTKEWNCSITIGSSVTGGMKSGAAVSPGGSNFWNPADEEDARGVLVHELAHAMSYLRTEPYRADPGWEEGVVEAYRQSFMAVQAYGADELARRDAPGYRSYSPWVNALDGGMRLAGRGRTHGDRLAYYRELLPLAPLERSRVVDRWILNAGHSIHVELTGRPLSGEESGQLVHVVTPPKSAGQTEADVRGIIYAARTLAQVKKALDVFYAYAESHPDTSMSLRMDAEWLVMFITSYEDTGKKHLPGQHDQDRHGGGRGRSTDGTEIRLYGDEVSRGLVASAEEIPRDVAERLVTGTATAEDVLSLIDADEVGIYWVPGSDDDPSVTLGDAQEYATIESGASVTQILEEGEDVEEYGADIGVILVGEKPDGWDPDRENPPELAMGNSYINRNVDIPLKTIYYDAGNGWHQVDATGTSVHVGLELGGNGKKRGAQGPKHLPGEHDQLDHGRRGPSSGGFTPGPTPHGRYNTLKLTTDLEKILYEWNDPSLSGPAADDGAAHLKTENVNRIGTALAERAKTDPELKAQLEGIGQRVAEDSLWHGMSFTEEGLLQIEKGPGLSVYQKEHLHLTEGMTITEVGGREVAAKMQDTWMQTASDDAFLSWAMQLAVADRTGADAAAAREYLAANDRMFTGEPNTMVLGAYFPDSAVGPFTFQDKTEVLADSPAVKAYVDEVYGETQRYLAERGIDEITVYRGVHQRGKLLPGVDPNITLNPLSSFSTKRTVAESFAQQDGGDSGRTHSILTTTVPADRVFALPTTGPGCLSETELLVVGGPNSSVLVEEEVSPW